MRAGESHDQDLLCYQLIGNTETWGLNRLVDPGLMIRRPLTQEII